MRVNICKAHAYFTAGSHAFLMLITSAQEVVDPFPFPLLGVPLKYVLTLIACATVAFAAQSKPAAKAPAAKKPASVTFKDVQPIFNENCIGCHSGERARAGIDFSTYQGVMNGSDDGPIVKKGAPKHSLLIEALRGLNGVRQMPPRRDPLSEDKIALIEKWIATGAKP